MYDVKLVAVEHAIDSTLVGSHMTSLIVKKVVPLLKPNTVIVAEGGKKRGMLLPGFPGYDVLHSQLGPLASLGYTPAIFSDDYLYEGSTVEEVVDRHSKIPDYQAMWSRCVKYRSRPRTWEELIAIVKGGTHKIRMVRKMDSSWKSYALSLNDEFRKRDEQFISQILRLANERPVIFIGGVIHCVSLEATHGWETIRYECDENVIGNFYSGWYCAYKSSDHYS